MPKRDSLRILQVFTRILTIISLISKSEQSLLMSTKEKYKENRTTVFKIMGIDPDDRRYNCHHIIERSDYGRKKDKVFWDDSVPSGRFDIDGISNLFPLKVEVHAELHRRLDGLEGTLEEHSEIIRRKRQRKEARGASRHRKVHRKRR